MHNINYLFIFFIYDLFFLISSIVDLKDFSLKAFAVLSKTDTDMLAFKHESTYKLFLKPV